MGETVNAERHFSKGRKRRVSVPLELDELDRPTWALRSSAPPGARWVEVPDGNGTDPTGYRRGFVAFYAPGLLLPVIPRPEPAPAYGRPRAETDSAARVRCQATACAVDLLGYTVYSLVAHNFTFGSGEARRKQAGRDHMAGRRSLWREGVLPWGAWPEGRLPDAEWQKAPELMAALTEWERQAVLDPAAPPATPLQKLLAASLEGSRRQLMWAPAMQTPPFAESAPKRLRRGDTRRPSLGASNRASRSVASVVFWRSPQVLSARASERSAFTP